MKKFGFTLAEMLITLAIIGFVASLTLPSLNSNINNRRVGPGLAKAINNLENANRMILVENEIETINEIDGDAGYINALTEHLNASWDGENFVITGKDGIVYTIASSTSGGNHMNSRKYSGTYYDVGIDINGVKGPNRANSDRFLVHIDSRGSVIPAGSLEGENYFGNESYSSMVDQCINNVPAVLNSYGICTAAIINSGWEMNYKTTAKEEDSDFSAVITPGTLPSND